MSNFRLEQSDKSRLPSVTFQELNACEPRDGCAQGIYTVYHTSHTRTVGISDSYLALQSRHSTVVGVHLFSSVNESSSAPSRISDGA